MGVSESSHEPWAVFQKTPMRTSAVKGSPHMSFLKDPMSSNGNDFETKRNNIFDNRGIFSIEVKRTHSFQNLDRSKQSEHYYYYSLQDRRNTEHN
jgi:hypothetical protein